MEADLKLGMRYLGISFRANFFFKGVVLGFRCCGGNENRKTCFQGTRFPPLCWGMIIARLEAERAAASIALS